jgi:hypothetical protein
MRLFSKIFFILSLLSVLCALSPRPIYALACSGTGYTCRKFDCAVGEVEDTSRTCTLYDYICCKKVPTSTPVPQPTKTPTPKPTNTPASQNCNWIGYTCVGSCAAGYSCQAVGSYTCACVANTQPTNTPPGGIASPTVTPPGCWCQNGKCVGNLTFCRYIAVCPTPACSQFSQNANIQEYCKTTGETCGTQPCAGYSASCVTTANCNKYAPGCGATTVPADCAYNAPGCNVCGYARVEAIYCNGVHCGDTCVPHALCSNSPWCSGGGSTNPTNTPTPTAFLRLRLLNPALSPVASSDVTLCKVRCDTAPCSAVSCQSGLSLADFPGSILADRGGAIRDGPESPCYGPPSTVYRPPSIV